MSPEPRSTADAPEPVLPPQARMGLLDYVASTALDADYAEVAERRAAGLASSPHPAGHRRPARLGTVLVLATFALLLTVAAVQATREAGVQESGRDTLSSQVAARRAALAASRTRLAELRGEVAALQESQLAGSAEGRALQERLRSLGAVVGARPVRGPGMVVTVGDAPDARSDRERVLDGDLQRLVNGLWAAGAEAVAINGQRLTQLSAVRTAGEAITVNFKPLRPPYVVEVVGNPDELPARFIETAGGSWWLNLRSVYDLRFEMSSREELTLPAVQLDDLRLARVPEEAR